MKARDALPPMPWSYDISIYGHVYLVDANGRKIATILGKATEKEAMVKLFVRMSERFNAGWSSGSSLGS